MKFTCGEPELTYWLQNIIGIGGDQSYAEGIPNWGLCKDLVRGYRDKDMRSREFAVWEDRNRFIITISLAYFLFSSKFLYIFSFNIRVKIWISIKSF